MGVAWAVLLVLLAIYAVWLMLGIVTDFEYPIRTWVAATVAVLTSILLII